MSNACQLHNLNITSSSWLEVVVNNCPNWNSSTWPGNVLIQNYAIPEVSSGIYSIDLASLEGINGGLLVQNIASQQPFTIEAPQLATIARGVVFKNVSGLSLSSSWSSLTNFSTITFTDVTFASPYEMALQSLLSSASPDFSLIVANTNLRSISGFTSATSASTSLVEITITGNQGLTSIDLPGVGSANVTIENNGDQVNITMPDLASASSLIIGGASSFSASQLDTVGSAMFSGNGFSSLSIPNMHSLSENLNITNNAKLSSLSLPSLGSAQVIFVEDNEMLEEVNFSNLTSVSQLSLSAPMNSLDIDQAVLSDSSAGIDIIVEKGGSAPCPSSISLVPNHICTSVPSTTSHPASTATPSSIRVTISDSSTTYTTERPAPTTPSSKNPDGDNSSSSGGLSKADKIGVGVGVGLGVLLIAMIVLISILSCRRRSPSSRDSDTTSEYPADQKLNIVHLGGGEFLQRPPSPPYNPSHRQTQQSDGSYFHHTSPSMYSEAMNEAALATIAASARSFMPPQSQKDFGSQLDGRSFREIDRNGRSDHESRYTRESGDGRRSLEYIEKFHSSRI